jgi:hypothetical protein
MPEKTEAELRALRKLLDDGATFDAFPDGATWADVGLAEKLDADPFKQRMEESES